MSYPPGQQPPTWGPGQQPPAWQQPPTWQQQPPAWGGPPPSYSVNPGKAGTSPVMIAGIFIGILVAVIGIAAVLIFANQPPLPTAPCQPGVPCAPGGPSLPPVANASPTPGPGETPGPNATGAPPATPRPSSQPSPAPGSPAPVETPTSDSPPVVLGGSSWRSETLNFGFEYDVENFELSPQSDDNLAILYLQFVDAQVIVAATNDGSTPAAMIDRQVGIVDSFMIGRTEDRDDYDAVLGPGIGYVDGQVKVFSGVLTDSDGTPSAPGGVTIMAATNGRLTVAIVVIVASPDAQFGADTLQHQVRDAVDDIVKTFDWGSAQ